MGCRWLIWLVVLCSLTGCGCASLSLGSVREARRKLAKNESNAIINRLVNEQQASSLTMYPASTPRGAWMAIASDDSGRYLAALLLVAADHNNNAYQVSRAVLYTSDNYGVSWQLRSVSINQPSQCYVTSDASGQYLTIGGYGCGSGTYVSLDYGATWTFWILSYQYLEMKWAHSDATGQNIFGSSISSLYISKTYGFTWEYAGVSFNDNKITIEAVVCNRNFSFLAAIGCRTVDNELILWRRHTDSQWTNASLPINGTCQDASLAVDNSGQFLTIVVGYNILRSDNFGSSWYFVNNKTHVASGLNITGLYTAVVSDGSGDQLFLCGTVGPKKLNTMYLSVDSGASWNLIWQPHYYKYDYNPVMSNNGLLVAVATSSPSDQNQGGLFVTSDPYLYLTGRIQPSSLNGSYTFANMGYIGGTVYLSLVLQLSYADASSNSVLIVRSGNNGNSMDGSLLFQGRCNCLDSCLGQSIGQEEHIQCALNIPLNNSYFNTSDARNNAFTVTTLMNSTAPAIPCGGPASNEVISDGYYYYVLMMTISAIPMEAEIATEFVSVNQLTVAVIPIASAVFSLFGYLVAQKRKNHYRADDSKISRQPYEYLSVMLIFWRFGLYGFQLSTELWLYVVLSSCSISELYSIRLLTYAVVIIRAVHSVPTIYILSRLWCISRDAYSELIDRRLVMNYKVTMTVLTILSLGNEMLIRYFPWNAGLITQPGFGFPEKSLMDLCSSCGFWLDALSIVVQSVLINRIVPVSFKGSNLFVATVVFVYFSLSILKFAESLLFSVILQWKPRQWSLFEYAINQFSIPQSSTSWMDRLRTKVWKLIKSQRTPYVELLYTVKFSFALAAYLMLSTWTCFYSPLEPTPIVNDDTKHLMHSPTVTGLLIGIVFAYSVAIALSVWVVVSYDNDFDCHSELVDIAKSFSLDASKITKLLQLTTATYSLVEVFGVCASMAIYHYKDSILDSCPHNNQILYRDPFALCITITVLEFISPLLVHVVSESRRSVPWSNVLMAFARIDICIMTLLLKAMLSWVYPLSFLSSISILKSDWQTQRFMTSTEAALADDEMHVVAPATLLSFQLRDNWKDVDGTDAISDIGCCGPLGLNWIPVFVNRLSTRFTVLYSFGKLMATIAFTLLVNDAYSHCFNPGHYYLGSTCAVAYSQSYDIYSEESTMHHSYTCASSCFGSRFLPIILYPPLPADTNYPPLPPTPWECTVSYSGECLCNNWVVFQLMIIILHVIHYGVQCYFYIRYNYFDPQQNQINCVETYAFAGQNLMLFLTHPSMCFLSVLEAAAIVIVWVDVFLPPNAYCRGEYTINVSKLPFAGFITFMEVYKANVSTCLKLFKAGEYWWSVWSLVRIDLFVFYGFTLFLQTFFFPFSVVGHSVNAYRLLNSKDGDVEVGEGLREDLISNEDIHESNVSLDAGSNVETDVGVKSL
jgi:hypothetical protein